MELFDEKFEGIRLAMLANQFPESVQYLNKIIFLAERDASGLHCRWFFIENTPKEQKGLTEFRSLMTSLLGDLISYRKKHNITPNNEGIITINQGKLSITWVIDGGTELSEK